MKISLGVALFGLSFSTLTPSIASADAALMRSFSRHIEPILDQYCYDCHGLGISEGNVTFDEFTADTIDNHTLWLRVLKNTRAHIMPPREELQPSMEERKALADWIKSEPFAIDPENPDPGKMTVQRLNREEYGNTIRDLLDIEFDAYEAFPADDSGEGFDNLGEVLTISPMLLEKYLDAAQSIIEEAVPTRPLVIQETVLTEERLVSVFSTAVEGDEEGDNLYLSFYQPSARVTEHAVDQAGDYQIILRIQPKSFSSFRGFDYNRCRFTFSVDGETLLDKEFEYVFGRTHEHVFDFNWNPGNKELRFEVQPLTPGLEQVKNLKMEVVSLAIRGPLGEEHWTAPPNYEKFFPGGVPEKSITQEALRPQTAHGLRHAGLPASGRQKDRQRTGRSG